MTGLYEWLRMPQRAVSASDLFVSVMRLVTTSPDNICVYVDAFGLDDCPIDHVATTGYRFREIAPPQAKPSPNKSRIGATRRLAPSYLGGRRRF